MTALPPFRLDLTAWALRRRPNNQIDQWDGDGYRRILRVGPEQSLVEATVRQGRSPGEPELHVTLSGAGTGPAAVPAAREALGRLLGLNVDLYGFYRLAEGDPKLGSLARRFYGLKPPRFPTVFEALGNAIACQQVTLALGLLLLTRLAQAYGGTGPARGGTEVAGPDLYAFPRPEALAALEPEALRPLGYSRQKARYLVELARAVAGGKLDLEALAALDDDEALARLRRLRGVGRWSAEYTLLRGLGRLNVFPGDDVGARNTLQHWLGLPEKLDYDRVKQVTARWQPYSGLVYLHLLLHSLQERRILVEAAPAGDGP